MLSFSTLTSTYASSINDEVCYLKNAIHKKIKYSGFFRTQAISALCASDVMKKQVKLLSHKKWNPMILECFLRYKYMKEVLP